MIDTVITNIGRLITCAAPDGPLRGAALAQVASLDAASIAIPPELVRSV